MLRAVMVSRYDQGAYRIPFRKSAGLAMQMHKEAMMDIAWKTDYQVDLDEAESPDPIMTESKADMPPAKQALALHDQMTRRVTLTGMTTVLGDTSPVRCVCIMDNYRSLWEARSVSLDIGAKHYEFVYSRVPGPGIPKYEIHRLSDNEGPQLAKV